MECNHECVSKFERKCLVLESKFLEAWAILHNFLKQGCCRHLFQAVDLSKNKQRSNCEAEMMARKVHVCIKIWDFHLVTPPKCQTLPSFITKTAHVKFRATLGSLSTTCGNLIGVKIRSLSWLGVSTLVTMPYNCWHLWRANCIEDFKWCLHFQFGVAFWRAILREACILKGQIVFEGHWRLQSWTLFTWFPIQWANWLLLVGNLSNGWLLKDPTRPGPTTQVCGGGPHSCVVAGPCMWA